jgi:hypothetical protein
MAFFPGGGGRFTYNTPTARLTYKDITFLAWSVNDIEFNPVLFYSHKHGCHSKGHLYKNQQIISLV